MHKIRPVGDNSIRKAGAKMEKKDDIPVNFPTAPFGKFGIPLIDTDPFGTYTGVPKNRKEKPQQDADDL